MTIKVGLRPGERKTFVGDSTGENVHMDSTAVLIIDVGYVESLDMDHTFVEELARVVEIMKEITISEETTGGMTTITGTEMHVLVHRTTVTMGDKLHQHPDIGKAPLNQAIVQKRNLSNKLPKDRKKIDFLLD